MSGVIDGIRNFLSGHRAGASLHSAEGEVATILNALTGVIDPELGLDIVNLGLIRAIDVDGAQAALKMTLTTEGCPVGPALVEEVEKVVRDAGFEPQVELVFTPAWHPDDVSAEGKRFLDR